MKIIFHSHNSQYIDSAPPFLFYKGFCFYEKGSFSLPLRAEPKTYARQHNFFFYFIEERQHILKRWKKLNLSSAESSLLYEYKVSLSTGKQTCMVLILEEGK